MSHRVNYRYRMAFQMSVVVLALAVLAYSHYTWSHVSFLTNSFILALSVAVISETQPLSFPRFGRFSLAEPMAVAVACLYGPLACAVVVLASSACRFLCRNSDKPVEPLFVAYAASQGLLCNCGLALLYHGSRTLWGAPSGHLQALDFLALTASVILCYGLQCSIIAACQFLEQFQVGVWTSRLNWSRLRLAAQAFLPLGALSASAQQEGVLVFALLLAPLAVTYNSLRRYTETLREAREVVENLAQAVEKREPHTVGHANRVALLATDVARVMHMDEFSVGCVATAARLHELGKISVGDRILCKSGSLKESEWVQIRRYPEVGAKVTARLSLSRKESELIRFHQEHFNGGGYYGVGGDAIPLGSRILGAAKAFDAMISSRAYRPALTVTQAVKNIREQAGLQFDPKVVEALMVCLKQNRMPAALAA